MPNSEKTRIAVHVWTRKGKRGELVRIVCWTSEISEARAWTLIEDLRALLIKQPVGSFYHGTVSQEQEEARLRSSAP